VNRFNFFERSYKVIPQLGDADRATVAPLLDLKIKTPDGRLGPVSSFTRIETAAAAAHAQPLPAAQSRAGVRRRAPGRHEGGGAARARGGGGLGGRARRRIDHAGESRQIRRRAGR
jgi:multidrug efflux pump